MRIAALLTVIWLTGCAAEWDVPKVPQRNPWTHKMESKYVYFPAYHPLPPPNFNPNSQQ